MQGIFTYCLELTKNPNVLTVQLWALPNSPRHEYN